MESAVSFFNALALSNLFFWHDEPPIDGEYSENIAETPSKENYSKYLPPEVLRLIFSRLPLRRIATLQLVCRTWNQVGKTIDPQIRAINSISFVVQNKFQMLDFFQNRFVFGKNKKKLNLIDCETKHLVFSKNSFVPIHKKYKAYCPKRKLIVAFSKNDKTISLKEIFLLSDRSRLLFVVWNLPIDNKSNDLRLCPRQIIFFSDRIALLAKCYFEKIKNIEQYAIKTFSVENGASLAECYFPNEIFSIVLADGKDLVCINTKKEVSILDVNLKLIRKFKCLSLIERWEFDLLLSFWNIRIQLVAGKLLIPTLSRVGSCQIIDLNEGEQPQWIKPLLKKCSIDAFDSDGDYLAMVTRRSTKGIFGLRILRCIEIWDLVHGELIRKIPINRSDKVWDLRFFKGVPPNLPNNFLGYPACIALDGIEVWSSPMSW